MPSPITLVTDLVQQTRAEHPDLKLPPEPTVEDRIKASKAHRAYLRALRRRIRVRFGLAVPESE